jgi:hypothetical protein
MYDDIEDEFDIPTHVFHKDIQRDAILLRDVVPVGPVIAHLDDHDIAEAVIDIDGNRYAYRGLARRRQDGRVDWQSLKRGQYLVEPCFIYEFAPPPGITRRRLSLWRRLRGLLRFELPMPAQNLVGGRR